MRNTLTQKQRVANQLRRDEESREHVGRYYWEGTNQPWVDSEIHDVLSISEHISSTLLQKVGCVHIVRTAIGAPTYLQSCTIF